MAIFSTRSSTQRGQEAVRKSNQPVDSVETLRTRARQRLIGAFVLVVLGVIAFTLMFDTQPRPIPVDIEINIPDKDKAERLAIPSTPAVPPAVVSAVPTTPTPAATVPPVAAVAAGAAAVAANNVQNSASLSPKEEIVAPKPAVKTEVKTEAKPEAKPEAKVEKKPEAAVAAKAEPKAAVKSEVKAEVKPVAKPVVVDDGAKAKAILEGKDPVKESAKEPAKAAAADTAGRFVVQVGAFSDLVKAHEVRVKVERAGLKTYTHVAQTKDGARTRVRVGPFSSRAEAEKAAAKIKNLDLPAAILTL